jgi:hypothetical protein
VSLTAPVQDQIYNMAKPMSAPAGIISREATVLWRDIGIYRASRPVRMAGPMYEVTSYETKAECEAAQQAAAMAKEARYLCRLAVAGPAPVR